MGKNNLETLRELVPLYVQGELSEEEKVDFEKGLQRYPELQDDLLACSTIESYYQEIETKIKPPTSSAFEAIQQRITPNSDQKRAKSRQPSSVEKVKEWFTELFTVPRLGWGIAAVQCAVIVLLLVPAQQQTSYKTLTSSEAPITHQTTLQLVFDERSTEKEIRQIMTAIHAEITGGPTAEGMYQVSLQENSDVDSIITTLRTKKNVLFVEKAL